MYNTGERKLVGSKVLRYKNTGKLVVHGGDGYYLDLDKSLQFTSKDPHKINPSTELEDTEWLIEYEREGQIENRKWKYVRSYSIHDLPSSDELDLSIPLENRINISPSELFNIDESLYIKDYINSGSWKKRVVIAMIMSSLCYYMNVKFGVAIFVIWLFFIIKQFSAEKVQKEQVRLFNQGVDDRKNEVLEAKKRVRLHRKSKIDAILSNFDKWKNMDGQEFEVATGKLFKKRGYSIEYTPSSNDGGIDLVLSKDTERIGVQCKAHNKNVGIAAVRELHGVKSQWTDLKRFMLVGLHGFSRQAKVFANQHNIELFSIENDHFKIG